MKGKMLILLMGIILSVAGALIVAWRWRDLVIVFWGLAGVMLLGAGVLALAIAISEITISRKE